MKLNHPIFRYIAYFFAGILLAAILSPFFNGAFLVTIFSAGFTTGLCLMDMAKNNFAEKNGSFVLGQIFRSLLGIVIFYVTVLMQEGITVLFF